MIEESLKWAGVKSVTRMVDVGCGLGGSSRHIVRMFKGASATGITLSGNQASNGSRPDCGIGLCCCSGVCVLTSGHVVHHLYLEITDWRIEGWPNRTFANSDEYRSARPMNAFGLQASRANEISKAEGVDASFQVMEIVSIF